MDSPRSAPVAKPPANEVVDEPAASVQPLVAEAESPLPQRRRFGGLTAGPEPRESALDSVDLSWLAQVPVGKTLAVPVGVAMAVGAVLGSFAPTIGMLGAVLLAAGSLTLAHAYGAARDGEDDDGGTGKRLSARLQPVTAVLGALEITTWAMLLAAAGAWWFNRWSDDIPLAARAILAAALVLDVAKAVLTRDDE